MGEISGVKQCSHHDALVEDSSHVGRRAVARFLSALIGPVYVDIILITKQFSTIPELQARFLLPSIAKP